MDPETHGGVGRGGVRPEEDTQIPEETLDATRGGPREAQVSGREGSRGGVRPVSPDVRRASAGDVEARPRRTVKDLAAAFGGASERCLNSPDMGSSAAQRQLNALSAENDQLRNKLSDRNRQVEELTSQLEACQRQLEEWEADKEMRAREAEERERNRESKALAQALALAHAEALQAAKERERQRDATPEQGEGDSSLAQKKKPDVLDTVASQAEEADCEGEAADSGQGEWDRAPHALDSPSPQFGAVGWTSLPLFTAARDSMAARDSGTVGERDTGAGGAASPRAQGQRSADPEHTTDTASIRARTASLERGPKSAKDLTFADHKSLFKPNLIIEFAEDSPAFRRKVDALDQNVEGLRGHLQQLVSTARKYCDGGNAFCERGRELASKLMNMEGESWFTRLGDLAAAMVRFGETVDLIQNYTEALLLSLETTFSAPMEEFVKREVKFIRKMKQEVWRAGEDLETATGRFLQLKRNAEEGVTQLRAAEVAAARRRFELARFDLVHLLNQLETKKKFQLVERVCSALYAYLGVFHQCHTLVANLEPSMRDLQSALHLARKDLARDDRLWTAKRMQLDKQLGTGHGVSAPEDPAMLPPGMGPAHPPQPGPPMASTFPQVAAQASPRRRAAALSGLVPGASSTVGYTGDGRPNGAKGAGEGGKGNGGILFGGAARAGIFPATSMGAAAFSSDDEYDDPDVEVEVMEAGPGGGGSGGEADLSDTVLDTDAIDRHILGGGKGRSASMSRQELGASVGRGGDGLGGTAAMGTLGGGALKAGYLWKRSNNVRKDWKRRFFFLQAGKLFYQRQEMTASPPVRVCDVKLCTVRSCEKDTDLRFSFEIISPKHRTYMLQAEDEESHQAWVEAIRLAIEQQLSTTMPPHTGSNRRRTPALLLASSLAPQIRQAAVGDLSRPWDEPGAQDSPLGTSSRTSQASTGEGTAASGHGKSLEGSGLDLERLAGLSKVNPCCVDCGKDSPEWASINLGVMMCIECSGIHRAMGVHVSKVRSLTLDKWTDSLAQVMECVGNTRSNLAWEGDAKLVAERKIGPGCDRPTREAFIRDKYQAKLFLDPKLDTRRASLEEVSARLFSACRQGDMEQVLHCLAHGADVNWPNPRDAGRTAAHAAVSGGQVPVLELLAQNGCNLDAVSDTEEAPLDVAIALENQDMIDVLVNKLEREQKTGGSVGA